MSRTYNHLKLDWRDAAKRRAYKAAWKRSARRLTHRGGGLPLNWGARNFRQCWERAIFQKPKYQAWCAALYRDRDELLRRDCVLFGWRPGSAQPLPPFGSSVPGCDEPLG